MYKGAKDGINQKLKEFQIELIIHIFAATKFL